jgi:hypothetical protein
MSNGRGFSRSRRVVLAGGAALALGGAVVGTVAAQQHRQVVVPAPLGAPGEKDFRLFYRHVPPEQLAERQDAWLRSVAEKLGVTPENLKQAMDETTNELGFPPGLIAAPLPGADFTIEIDPGFAAAASALNIPEEQLREEWQGKSLAEVAKAHNVDPKVVADAIKAQRIADLDRAVAEGKLPLQMAERLKAHLDMEIQHFMNLPGAQGGGPAIIRFERHIERTEP